MRVPATAIDPTLKIYLHGTRFHYSMDALLDRGDDPKVMHLVASPMMVLSSFCSELYLKCLLHLENGTAPRVHNLNSLFDRLRPATKEVAKRHWLAGSLSQAEANANIAKLTGRVLPQDIEFHLRLSSQAFEEQRYAYEKTTTNFTLIILPRVLRLTILEIRPDWRSIQPAQMQLMAD